MTKEEKQKAIDALKMSVPIYAMSQEEFNDYIQTLNKVMDWLEQEPKTGHWIPLGNYDDWGNENSYKCSECGDIDTYPDNYCHNCGADMRGEE